MADALIDWNWGEWYTPYRYSQLTSQDSIRLIKIFPELICDQYIGVIISEHAHSTENVERVEYRALSYLWGDPDPVRQIGLLDGTVPRSKWRLHRIHSNLWLFLAHMWRKEQFDCLLWTDCLCLNQEDEEEMAQQIPRMGLIYGQAERVVIWLGLSAWQEQHFQEQRDDFNDQNRLVPFLNQSPQRRLAILSVLEHNFWQRMWITQEVAIARKVVVEMQDIPSCDLYEMHQMIRAFIRSPGGHHMARLVEMRGSGGRMPLEPQSSGDLLQRLWQRRSTRPQDVIYGLLGMVKEDDPLRQITVDYDKPASDVLFDALFMVSSTRPVWPRDQNYRILKIFMSLGLLKDVNSLEEYSHRDHSWKLTENKVVKAFAKISLEVFDAFNLIIAHGGLSLSNKTDEAVKKLVEQIARLNAPGVDEYQWKVIIGIFLTLAPQDLSGTPHEQWKAVRWPNMKAQPLWLCSGHALSTSLPAPPAPKQLHMAVDMPLAVSTFRPNYIVKACANNREHESPCGGSKMILEVSGSRTRLVLDYATAPRKVVLNIWFRGASSSTQRLA